ncbi:MULTISPECIES: LysR family transcriptional regulator [unclassified Beijerinckia]|uniref:LysR family transcriptional regulator n=1 Tax=unclassified Beijerinckia TaxID=2638183 RepID=UPI00089A68C9|nr:MULTISPECIES: LysR family transcriptional regulator [unclassified Beijerinckia]MDH7798288.1 DNA-binding transcriptional LysR family regulator [Beijerinckia sp. GAS462]SED15740.1 DNA-binding transcriptional regulator, LysR family [Beijerinckia sp. 28-YEA-48]
MNITLRQLYGFKAVAEAGTFTAAAQRLGLAQPALSQIVRELEEELDARLFDRTTRRVELTAAGREFLQAVDRLIEDLEHAVHNTRELAHRKRGRLVIAAPPLLAAMIVPQAIQQYKRKFPRIEVVVLDIAPELIVDRVRRGDADCGIGTFPDEQQGVRHELLFQDSMMAWCAPSSPVAAKKSLDWSDIPSEDLITLTRESRLRFLLDHAYESLGLSVKPAHEVSQVTTAVMMVAADLGIAVLPSYTWRFAQAFGVLAKPLTNPDVRRDVSIIYSETRALSPAAMSFLRLLRAQKSSLFPPNAG